MHVACVQPVFEPGASGTDRVAQVLDRLRGLGSADLIVLPELWHVGYFDFDSYAGRAEPLDGRTVTSLCGAAVELGSYIHGGSIVERSADGRLYNTSVLISPDGKVVHTYRKVHLFGYRSREVELLTPGTDVGAVDTELGRIAMTTCYDLRFPELFRSLEGAEIVLVASAWPVDRIEHWRLLTRARALENLSYLIACNAAGVDNGVTLGGRSVVVDPWGDVVAEAGDGDEILNADVDVPRAAKLRAEFPWVEDRRLTITLDR
jgi:predicted amidohydrolase